MSERTPEQDAKVIEANVAKVERYLRKGGPFEILEDNLYRVRDGSAQILISVHLLGNGKPFVRLLSYVLREVKKAGNEAMFEDFCKLNDEWVFGKIYWRENQKTPGEGYIMLEHNLLAEFLDFEELAAAVGCLGWVADDIDDKLKAKYGGKRFVDE